MNHFYVVHTEALVNHYYQEMIKIKENKSILKTEFII